MSCDIVLVGDGHGARAALTGLKRAFDRVEVVSEDEELISVAYATAPTFAEASAPLAVLAGSRTILGAEEIARRPVFNVHYSLLPKYRGLHSVVWAMLNDEAEIGLTIHQVDEGIDTGPILHQHAERVSKDDTSQDLMERLNAHVAEHLGIVLREWQDGERDLREQDHEQATWVARRNLEDCLIHFDDDNRQLELFFRALVEPYPLPAIRCRKGRFEVTGHRLLHRPYRASSGRVVNVAGAEAFIKTREGLLVVSELRGKDGTVHPASDIVLLGERLA